MSSRRVLKFGGAGLRDGESVRRAAAIVRRLGGERPVVVVSAHEGVTGLLAALAGRPADWRSLWDRIRVRHRTLLRELGLAGDLLDRHLGELRTVLAGIEGSARSDLRSRDHILSFGERMSARVVAAALRAAGTPAAPLDAFDLGLTGERRGGLFQPSPGTPEGVRTALASLPGVPVVTGFLATDRAGHLTTLGRNGSDLSAVWIAAAAGAREVHLWKAVAGVMTADPRLVPRARCVEELAWDVAAELAGGGAEVLHPGAVEPARRAGIAIRVRDVRAPDAPGTRLVERTSARGPQAIAHRLGIARRTEPFDPRRDPSLQLAELGERLREQGAQVLQGSFRGTELAVLFAEPANGDGLADEAIAQRGGELDRGLGCVTLAGPGVGDDAELEREIGGRCQELGVRLVRPPVAAGARARFLLVAQADVPRLVRALHARWFEDAVPEGGSRREGEVVSVAGATEISAHRNRP